MTTHQTPEQLDELEKKARAATPGPWIRWSYEGDRDGKHRNSVCHHVGDLMSSDHECVTTALHEGEAKSVNNAEYIAACDPQTVVSLLSAAHELERLTSALEFIANHAGDFDLWVTEKGERCCESIESQGPGCERADEAVLAYATRIGWRPEGGDRG